MKNTFIAIIVLVVIALGVLLFMNKTNKLEAPASPEAGQAGNVNPVNSGTTGATSTTTGTTVVTTTVTTTPSPVKEFVVTGQNFSFTPNMITVKKGDRVKITFKNTQGFHDFKIDEFGVATKQASSPDTEVLEFTADKAGNFEYYCSVGSHRSMGMVGTLKVE